MIGHMPRSLVLAARRAKPDIRTHAVGNLIAAVRSAAREEKIMPFDETKDVWVPWNKSKLVG